MFTVLSNTRNSNLYLLAALATVIVVILAIAFTPAVSAPRHVLIPQTSRSDAGTDYYQRHPELNVPAAFTADEMGDFALRHQKWTRSAQAAIPVTGNLAASDYFQRHPELSSSVSSSADMSDFAARHPELRTPATSIDISDYFLRH